MRFVFLFVMPFLYSFINEYKIINEYVFDAVIVEYGNVVYDDDSDGYIKIFDIEDNVLLKEIKYDSKANDFFKYLAIVSEDSFLIVCDSFYFNEPYTMPVYRDSIILKYNLEGELLDKEYLEFRPTEYYNHNNLLILKNSQNEVIYNKELNKITQIEDEYNVIGKFEYQYQGIAYINDEMAESIDLDYPGNYNIQIVDMNYTFNFFVTVETDYKFLGQKYVGGYLGEVSFYSFGELYLDNELYNIGEPINEVGNHHILILGINDYRKEVDFVILPDISYNDGVAEGQLLIDANFSSPIRVYSNAQSMFLNDEFYNSDYINSVGSYTISFYGVNGYYLEIPFKIYPKITGLEDNMSYESVEFNVFGEALLNGVLVTGNISLINSGNYKLELLFEDEIYETFDFQILDNETVVEEIEVDYSDYFKYVFLFVAVIGGMLFLRKK